MKNKIIAETTLNKPQKKTWQKPDFYLIDSDNVNAPNNKAESAYYERSYLGSAPVGGGLHMLKFANNHFNAPYSFTVNRYVLS